MALIITLKVIPSSGKVAWIYDKQERLKLYVKSPAQQGHANKEVIKIIAHMLKIPQSIIHILAGETGRTKIIKIDHTITLDQFLTCVGVGKQETLFAADWIPDRGPS